MKSVMYFNPKETRKERADKFMQWQRDNKAGRYIPTAEETRRMLYEK